MKAMNRSMKKLIDSSVANADSVGTIQLSKVLWPNFREVEDCVLMNTTRQSQDLDFETIVERYGDKSGFEAATNHIHLNDYLPHLATLERIGLAVTLLEIWGMKLQSQFPGYMFHLLMSVDEEDDEISLRFYRLRENQGSWYNMDNIDNYAEALLVMEVGPDIETK